MESDVKIYLICILRVHHIMNEFTLNILTAEVAQDIRAFAVVGC